jgi:hypothetical protein
MMVAMTGEPLHVPLAELRRAFDVLLRHVEATVGDAVALDRDYFWSIPGDELYDVPNEPELTIGQVSEYLQDMLAHQMGIRGATWCGLPISCGRSVGTFPRSRGRVAVGALRGDPCEERGHR